MMAKEPDVREISFRLFLYVAYVSEQILRASLILLTYSLRLREYVG